MPRSRLMLAAAAVLAVVAGPARSEGAAEALRQFGLAGVWSPDCRGAFRVLYTAPAEGPASVRVFREEREIAASEIVEILVRNDSRIGWTSRITAWELPDQPNENWMPAPGEIWETEIEKIGARIRPLRSQRRDGGKVSVRDGFIYDGEPVKEGAATVWRNTGTATLPMEKCPTGPAAGVSDTASKRG